MGARPGGIIEQSEPKFTLLHGYFPWEVVKYIGEVQCFQLSVVWACRKELSHQTL